VENNAELWCPCQGHLPGLVLIVSNGLGRDVKKHQRKGKKKKKNSVQNIVLRLTHVLERTLS
jgi:hypothetical protein